MYEYQGGGDELGDWDLRRPTTTYKIGTNENLLCSTGSSTQGCAVTEMGRKSKNKGTYVFVWASLKAQLEKNLPAMQETWLDSWVRKICWRRDRLPTPVFLGFPDGSADKESACNAGDLGCIPGLGRSPGEGKGYPLQYSGLENSMDCIVNWAQEVNHDWATFTFMYLHNWFILLYSIN